MYNKWVQTPLLGASCSLARRCVEVTVLWSEWLCDTSSHCSQPLRSVWECGCVCVCGACACWGGSGWVWAWTQIFWRKIPQPKNQVWSRLDWTEAPKVNALSQNIFTVPWLDLKPETSLSDIHWSHGCLLCKAYQLASITVHLARFYVWWRDSEQGCK